LTLFFVATFSAFSGTAHATTHIAPSFVASPAAITSGFDADAQAQSATPATPSAPESIATRKTHEFALAPKTEIQYSIPELVRKHVHRESDDDCDFPANANVESVVNIVEPRYHAAFGDANCFFGRRYVVLAQPRAPPAS
jgi:hypothetical protein